MAGLLALPLPLAAQQLVDNFNRPNDNVVGNGWTEVETAPVTSVAINTNMLRMGSSTAGRDHVWMNSPGLYNTTLGANACMLTWAFNMRQSRPDPSGFDASNFGQAVVLAGSNSNLLAGQGYAVALGNSGATDPIRLVRYNGGLGANANVTNLIAASDFGTEYLDIRVTYTPATGTWALYYRNNGTGGPFGDPTTAATLAGTIVDNTYTGVDLPVIGCLWNHNTAVADNAVFDNLHVPNSCTPQVNFAQATASSNEAAGTVAVNLTISPPAPVAGNVVLTVTNGPGMVYGGGGDYTTSPAVAGGVITLPVVAGATTLSFDILINDDALPEPTEQVTFQIGSVPAGMVAGTGNVHVHSILDNDSPPTITFSTLSIAAMESGGAQLFQLSVAPPPSANEWVEVSITNGLGAVYGADYTTGPAGPVSFQVPVPTGAATASFTATIINDVLVELDETVTFTLTGSSAGLTIGTNTVATLTIYDDDGPPTVLEQGDLAILAVNANNSACGSDDEISFVCFKNIVTNTTIDLTDNGYERCLPGLWGETEGVLRLTRTGPAVPRGTVITMRITNNVITVVSPDGFWSSTSLNGLSPFNLNSGGDQLFFMQGGSWVDPTPGANDHNADYTGTILYAFSTNGLWNAVCPTASGGTQNSNLPPGMECFSSGPTAITDFSKFAPASFPPRSQRGWLIEIDNVANWTAAGSITNCTNYGLTAPNYAAGFVLPITTTGFTPGLWTGARTIDWFDCTNWDDARVPVATTDVVIDETAIRNCVVNGGPTAFCNNLTIRSTGTSRLLTVSGGSTLLANGDFFVERTLGTGNLGATILANSTLSARSMTLTSLNGTLQEAYCVAVAPTAQVLIEEDVNILPGGFLDLSGGPSGGTLRVGRHFLNTAGTAHFDEPNSWVEFNGALDQNVQTSGFTALFGNLRMNKPGGDLVLIDPARVNNTLDLTLGRVMSGSGLTLGPTATAINASDLSFVHGPLVKVGTTNFTYPVGKGNSLRLMALTTITGTPTDAFRVEYFAQSPRTTFGNTLGPGLHHISDCEYWTIDQESGTPSARVTLSWDTPQSCGVTLLPDLRVARWDGAEWLDRGNGGTSGNTVAGTIITPVTQTVFSPWTLASVSIENPLPVELLHFDAWPAGSAVELWWATATESDNARFVLERGSSPDALTPFASVPGAGHSLDRIDYRHRDIDPLRGLSYYRLIQEDFDGTRTEGPTVAVRMGANGGLVLITNGEVLTVLHDALPGTACSILDATGRVVFNGTLPEGRADLSIASLPHGTYLLRVDHERGAATERFVR